MRSSRHKNFGPALAALAAASLLFGTAAFAVPGGPAGTQGSYKVTCRGSLEGDGRAALGAKSVTINLKLRDAATGDTCYFNAAGVDVENGRFNGVGKLGNDDAPVCGRIEPADGQIVKKDRLCGTVTLPRGGFVRFTGER